MIYFQCLHLIKLEYFLVIENDFQQIAMDCYSSKISMNRIYDNVLQNKFNVHTSLGRKVFGTKVFGMKHLGTKRPWC
jgi:hypothetical protein